MDTGKFCNKNIPSALFDTDDDRSYFLVEIHCHPHFKDSLELDNLNLDSKKDLEKGQEKGKKIIELITVNQYISMSDLSQRVGVSIKSIRTEIDRLKQSGIITRIGSDKGGYWQINKLEKQ